MDFFEQSFTACMPLLMATSAFGLGEDARVLLNGVTCTIFISFLWLLVKK